MLVGVAAITSLASAADVGFLLKQKSPQKRAF